MYESLLPSSWHHVWLLVITYVHYVPIFFFSKNMYNVIARQNPLSVFSPHFSTNLLNERLPLAKVPIGILSIGSIEFMQPKTNGFLALVDGKRFPVGDFTSSMLSPSMRCWRDKLGKASEKNKRHPCPIRADSKVAKVIFHLRGAQNNHRVAFCCNEAQ